MNNINKVGLKLAATAAGIYLEWDGDPKDWQPMYYKGKTYYAWDPENSDEDSAELAKLCGITVKPPSATSGLKLAIATAPDGTSASGFNVNANAAIRCAIFTCAVCLGVEKL